MRLAGHTASHGMAWPQNGPIWHVRKRRADGEGYFVHLMGWTMAWPRLASMEYGGIAGWRGATASAHILVTHATDRGAFQMQADSKIDFHWTSPTSYGSQVCTRIEHRGWRLVIGDKSAVRCWREPMNSLVTPLKHAKSLKTRGPMQPQPQPLAPSLVCFRDAFAS